MEADEVVEANTVLGGIGTLLTQPYFRENLLGYGTEMSRDPDAARHK